MADQKQEALKIAHRFIGLRRYDATPGDDQDTFICNRDEIKAHKLREANVWYKGDSDELLNFYTRMNTIDYNYEPWYNRNKQSYFWCVSSTEDDIKRTHVPIARDSVDTMVARIGIPKSIDVTPKIDNENGVKQARIMKNLLKEILEDNEFWEKFTEEQQPMTLVEGWGDWKIIWDTDISKYPMIKYYRAENVDFITKNDRIVCTVYKDYYTDDKGKSYLMVELRYMEGKDLIMERELYRLSGNDQYITPVQFEEVPEFANTPTQVRVSGIGCALHQPTRFFKDPDGDYGRSIYTGKFDLMDDLDQASSQEANTIRRSTPVEYIDTDYLERDLDTGMPRMPKVFEKKFISIEGSTDAEGVKQGQAVQVTQPNMQFTQYSLAEQEIINKILNGFMSPATLGIDVSRKDNADAQREKEKVTVFTRNKLILTNQGQLEKLFRQIMIAYKAMRGESLDPLLIPGTDMFAYSFDIKFSEFADDSFDNKLMILSQVYAQGAMSTEIFVDRLYGDTMSAEAKKKEIEWLDGTREGAEQNAMMAGSGGMMDPLMAQAMAAQAAGAPEDVNPNEEGYEGLVG